MIGGSEAIGLLKRIAAYFVGALLLMLVAGLLGGKIGYDKGKARCEGLVPDTVTIHHTDTITLTEKIHDTITQTYNKEVPVPFYIKGDTDTIVDSVSVSLPFERHLTHVEDVCDIYYSGFQPKIDSVIGYKHVTTQIIKQPYEVPKMPLLTAEVGVGGFYHEKQVSPYLFGEMRCNVKKTTWSAYGAVNHEAKWGVGVSVSYRFDLIK